MYLLNLLVENIPIPCIDNIVDPFRSIPGIGIDLANELVPLVI